jgi:hypothetical protein
MPSLFGPDLLFERLHYVDRYYDGPRDGLADCNGVPYFFACPFDEEADDYCDYFILGRAPDGSLQLASALMEIRRTWQSQIEGGLITIDTWIKMANEDPAYHRLATAMRADRIAAFQSDLVFRVHAEFQRIPGVKNAGHTDFLVH